MAKVTKGSKKGSRNEYTGAVDATTEAVVVAETKKVAAIAVTLEGDTVRVLERNVEVFAFTISTLSEDVRAAALFHGLKQKLVDAAAMSRNTETGAAATDSEKTAAVIAVAQRLVAGNWNRPAGEAGAATGGILVTALCELYASKTRAEIVAFVSGKTKAEQAALRAAPKVAAIIARLQSAAGKGIDSEVLLEGLE